MKRFKSKKSVIALLAVLVVAIASIGAYAYWTTTGSGSGTVENAAANGTVTLHADWNANALYPGGSQVVHFTADNAGATDLYVGTVTSVVTTSDPGCLPADFTIAPVVENQIIPAGSSALPLTNNGLLSFDSTDLNQDACKAPTTVTLTVSST